MFSALKDVIPEVAADQLIAKVVPIGQRFYPSDAAFPVREYYLHLVVT